MSDRERRGFLDEDPEEQMEKARVELFRLADQARTLEDSLYFWTAIYHNEGRGGRWSGKNPAANIVREMMTKRYFDPFYMDNTRLDTVTYTTDVNIIREIERQEKQNGGAY